MSVDKFGHRLLSGTGVGKGSGAKGPAGVGFKLTHDGKYDMQNKVLANVGNPVADRDAVNLSTLRINTRPFLRLDTRKRKYDARDKGICSSASPSEKDDLVTVKYLQDTCITYGDLEYIDMHGKRITNVVTPIGVADVVNLQYLDTMTLHMDEAAGFNYNAKSKAIRNLSGPVNETDAVNLKYMNEKCLRSYVDVQHHNNTNVWNAKGLPLAYVKSPSHVYDAVNVRYLAHVLGGVLHSLYSKLAPPGDKVKKQTKQVWIDENVTPFLNDEGFAYSSQQVE